MFMRPLRCVLLVFPLQEVGTGFVQHFSQGAKSAWHADVQFLQQDFKALLAICVERLVGTQIARRCHVVADLDCHERHL